MGSPERELCAWVTALNLFLKQAGDPEATPAEIDVYFRNGKTPEKAAERILIMRAPLQSVFAPTTSGEAGKPAGGHSELWHVLDGRYAPHSPTPIYVKDPTAEAGMRIIVRVSDPDHARRIVACVNACAAEGDVTQALTAMVEAVSYAGAPWPRINKAAELARVALAKLRGEG